MADNLISFIAPLLVNVLKDKAVGTRMQVMTYFLQYTEVN